MSVVGPLGPEMYHRVLVIGTEIIQVPRLGRPQNVRPLW